MRHIDMPIARWVHEHPQPEGFKQALRIVRWPGDYRFTLVLAALMIWRARCRWTAVVTLLFATAIASGLTALFKLCFGRMRPYREHDGLHWLPLTFTPWDRINTPNLSFPSGDATLAFATAAVFAVIVPRWRVAGYAWAVIVGITRVLQGAHYPSDVLGGALVGVITAQFIMRVSSRPPGATCI